MTLQEFVNSTWRDRSRIVDAPITMKPCVMLMFGDIILKNGARIMFRPVGKSLFPRIRGDIAGENIFRLMCEQCKKYLVIENGYKTDDRTVAYIEHFIEQNGGIDEDAVSAERVISNVRYQEEGKDALSQYDWKASWLIFPIYLAKN